jgi:hypothetical protein
MTCPASIVHINKINHVKVRPVKHKKGKDKRPFKGEILFPDPYSNIAIFAKKKSGKTSVISTILKNSINRNTKVLIFCTTYDVDPTWMAIIDSLNKAKIGVRCDKGIVDGRPPDLLSLFLQELTGQEEDFNEQPEEEEQEGPIHFGQCHEPSSEDDRSYQSDDEQPKPVKSKYLTPDFCLIFDDLPKAELWLPSVSTLMKKNRHHHIMTITSSQYIHDLPPVSMKQSDIWILFRGLDDKGIDKVYKASQSSLPYKIFSACYKQATSQPYNFFYINSLTDEIRNNFCNRFNIA